MYPDFAVPISPADGSSVATPHSHDISVRQLLSRNLAEIVRDIPIKNPVEIRQLAGYQILVVRDKSLFKTLPDSENLGRGQSHDYVKRIFGADTIFMLPASEKHSQKKAELNNWLSKGRIQAMVPDIAAEAACAVDSMLAHSAEPIDMDAYVLRYLFAVAAQAITGAPVRLGEHVGAFQANMGTMLSSASSTVQLALSSISRLFGHLLSCRARGAAEGMFEIGKILLRAGMQNSQPNLALDMLGRHGIDPKQIDGETPFPQELLHDISMTFAASIFTTSNLVLGAIHYFCREPEQLRELRISMENDFPGGVRNVKQLTLNPTLRMLWPVMLQQSSVDLAVRDVVAAGQFQDSAGTQYQINKGDIVVFDLAGTQKSLMDDLSSRMNALPAASPFLDLLDARHNDVNVAFFAGSNQCPGRRLFAADGLLLLLEVLQRMDVRLEAPDRGMQPGLVNTFPGATRMTVRPPAALDDDLHRQLLGGRPPMPEPELTAGRPSTACLQPGFPVIRAAPHVRNPLNP